MSSFVKSSLVRWGAKKFFNSMIGPGLSKKLRDKVAADLKTLH
jgi:hypothetical protein